MIFPSIETGMAMNARESKHYLPISRSYSVHQNSVEMLWPEIYQVRLFLRAEIYRERLLTFITVSSFCRNTLYWFLVRHFRCMEMCPLVIWIWNQNIAISTTGARGTDLPPLPPFFSFCLQIYFQ